MNRWRFRLAFALAILLGIAPPCLAVDRVALVVVNDSYPGQPAGTNLGEGRQLAQVLGELGFTVLLRENTSRAGLLEAARQFNKAADGADAALFFYSGQMMSSLGRTYLVPANMAQPKPEDALYYCLNLAEIYGDLRNTNARFKFILLDEAKGSTFAREWTPRRG
jgi:hypothetical protein